MRIDRRRFLTLLGLGGLSTALPSLGWNAIANAGSAPPPKRLVLWITCHGIVPRAWNLPMPGMPTDSVATQDITGLSMSDLPEIWQPLYPHRRKLHLVEGLAHATVIAEAAHVVASPGMGLDGNPHELAQAHLLTVQPALQMAGQVCIGGGTSIDQAIGNRTRVGARWASRLYGADHFRPYSWEDRGVASPRVDVPAQAFADLMGIYRPTTGTTSREDLIRAGRGSVLDLVADEFALASDRLGVEGKRKLDQHAQLVRELEMTFSSAALAPQCSLSLDSTGHEIDLWNRIMAMVLACDMSRVITFITPILDPPVFGFPADPDVHTYAHSSVVDDGAEPFRSSSELAMIAYNKWYADRISQFLAMLDSLPEGSGTVLDHTNFVWLTEHGTGTHEHHNVPIIVAGGGDGFFKTGQYTRYPRDVPSPWTIRDPFNMGPGLNRLHVTLMRAMGLPDDSFGQESFTSADGSTRSLTGPLDELIA